MNNADFLWKTLDTVNRWIMQADAKAAALLAANGVIAGMIFVRLQPILQALQNNCCLIVAGALGIIALLLSIFFAIRCVIPCLSVGEPRSVTFFHHISQLTAVDYETKLKDVFSNSEGVTKELTYQIWANSTVAAKKHRYVAFSIRSLVVAIIILLVVLGIHFGFYYNG